MDNNLFDNRDTKKDIKSWAKNVISEIKNAFGINSGSGIMKNEVGKYLSLDMMAGLNENNKYVVKAFNAMLEKLNYKRKLDLIDEDTYYKELEGLRDRYFSKGTQNWVKYTEQIYEYQKKSLEDEKKQIVYLYDDISKYALERIEEVAQKQEEFSKKLKNTGGLYLKNTVKMDNVSDVFYSLRDLDRDIEKIERYAKLLDDFAVKADRLNISGDIKKGFLDEVKALDVDAAMGVLTSLYGSDDLRFSKYLFSWDKKNKLSESVSKNVFSEEFESGIDDAYSHMKEVLTKAGYEVPEGFFASGSLSAQRFGDAFVEKFEEQMQRIRSLIDNFNAEISIPDNVPSGNTYNTSNTSYNITSSSSDDTLEKIRRFEKLRRFSIVN